MNKLKVSIEIAGNQVYVGYISGNSSRDSVFTYADEYVHSPSARPISISLPLQKESFSEVKTMNFFDGLLPEGFPRKALAKDIQRDDKDYVSILAELGSECLGAVQIGEYQENSGPEYIRMTSDEVKDLASEGVSKSVSLIKKAHLSLTGASGKVGLYYEPSDQSWYLPKGTAPSTHIVKQSHIRLNEIVVNEQLSLLTAQKLGIGTPDSFIVSRDGKDDKSILFATKRYDRIINDRSKVISGLKAPFRLHQEDFAQALGISSENKYELNDEHYLKRMMDLLRNYSADPMNDMLKLWDAIIFGYILGNTDGHLKNYSLIYSSDMRTVRLAPIYDIVATTIYKESTRNMAFAVNGKKSLDDIAASDFEKESKSIGVSQKITVNRLKYFTENFEHALESSASELLADGYVNVSQIRDNILKNSGFAVIR
ncbi:MAG: HipA domain-containing protein [Anaerolineaceae bacterium]|nr:HipA domain-containing protein [Anaerolineaceae bacterium]